MSLPRIEDTMQSPPGGWRYEQPETGFVVQGSGFVDLCAKIRLHRASISTPAGDPASDIHAWVCAKYPDICKIPPTSAEKTSFSVADVKAFLDAVREIGIKKGGTAFVPQEEADRRAAICIQCPHNKKIPGCYGCESIGKFVVLAIGNRASKWSDKLRQCAICGCSTEAKVHVSKEVILQTQAKDYVFPAWCWLH